MSENRVRNVPARFWVSASTADMVERIACAEDQSVSSVYRDLIEKGLVAGGYRSGQKTLEKMVQCAVTEAIRPQAERLAAISAKGTQISAASFFLAAYAGRQNVPDYLKDEYDYLASNARKLGVEYLKLSKDKNLDDFIERGLSRMEEND